MFLPHPLKCDRFYKSFSSSVYPLSAEFASVGLEIYCDFCSESIALDVIEVLWTLSFAGLKEASKDKSFSSCLSSFCHPANTILSKK